MPSFRCPNCNNVSNKFVNKCPKCGFERGLGKEMTDNDGGFKSDRERKRKRRLDGDKFRGGRNKSFVGDGGKQYTKRGNR